MFVALGKIGDRRAVPALSRLLEADGSPNLSLAIDALNHIEVGLGTRGRQAILDARAEAERKRLEVERVRREAEYAKQHPAAAPAAPTASSSDSNPANDSSSQKEDAPWDLRKIGAWVGIGIAAIIILAILASGDAAKCPACKKWWSRIETHRQLMDSHYSNREVTKTATTKDTRGNTLSTTNYVVNKVVNVATFDVFYRCKRCSHEWHQLRTVESPA